MKIRFFDGATVEGDFLGMLTGYIITVDERLEIEARDVRQMIHYLETNPEGLRKMLQQLLLRFEAERMGKPLCPVQPLLSK